MPVRFYDDDGNELSATEYIERVGRENCPRRWLRLAEIEQSGKAEDDDFEPGADQPDEEEVDL